MFLAKINFEDYLTFWQEIALIASDNDGLTASIDDIKNNPKIKLVVEIINSVGENNDNLLFQLFVTFYFSKSNLLKGRGAFEFTHRSFTEYLIGRKIIKTLSNISENINITQSACRDKVLDILDFIVDCFKLRKLDYEIAKYLQREIPLETAGDQHKFCI